MRALATSAQRPFEPQDRTAATTRATKLTHRRTDCRYFYYYCYVWPRAKGLALTTGMCRAAGASSADPSSSRGSLVAQPDFCCSLVTPSRPHFALAAEQGGECTRARPALSRCISDMGGDHSTRRHRFAMLANCVLRRLQSRGERNGEAVGEHKGPFVVFSQSGFRHALWVWRS